MKAYERIFAGYSRIRNLRDNEYVVSFTKWQTRFFHSLDSFTEHHRQLIVSRCPKAIVEGHEKKGVRWLLVALPSEL